MPVARLDRESLTELLAMVHRISGRLDCQSGVG